jgi:hypothetical protein
MAKVAGDAVYHKLMELSELLQDIDAMAPVRLLLGSIKEESPALAKLEAEIDNFLSRVQSLARGAKKG